MRKTNDIIFIIGVGRSGTSLLQSILNAHYKITFLPETHFLKKYVFKKRLPGNKDEIINILNKDEEFKRANIAPEKILGSNNNPVELYNRLCKEYSGEKEKPLWGDKDPGNIDFIPQLYKYFPSAKIIHIIRDPRDVVLSRKKAAWSSKYPFILHPLIYQTQMEKARRIGKRLYGENYQELYYEDLLTDTHKTLKKLCQFLGVDFEEQMLDFQKSSKELVSDQEMQWKKETFKPLMKDNINKWNKGLSDDEIYFTQVICRNVFKNHPYKKKQLQVGFLKKRSEERRVGKECRSRWSPYH